MQRPLRETSVARALFTREIRPMRFGISLAVLSVGFGFGLGGVFGALEDQIKDHLSESAKAVMKTTYAGDAAKAKKVVKKAWGYFKRAHLHGGAIGSAALALILLLSVTPGFSRIKPVIAFALGFGALGYSIFWMLAGLWAPGLGGTGAAKELLKWLAVPTSFSILLGLGMTLGVWTLATFSSQKTDSTDSD